MNQNQIVSMIFRLFLRRFVSFGVRRGMHALSGGGRDNRAAAGRDAKAPEADAADRLQQRQAEKLARNARKAARLTRRL